MGLALEVISIRLVPTGVGTSHSGIGIDHR
jgi:hypothetical protein